MTSTSTFLDDIKEWSGPFFDAQQLGIRLNFDVDIKSAIQTDEVEVDVTQCENRFSAGVFFGFGGGQTPPPGSAQTANQIPSQFVFVRGWMAGFVGAGVFVFVNMLRPCSGAGRVGSGSGAISGNPKCTCTEQGADPRFRRVGL